jgi:hypothetical protein
MNNLLINLVDRAMERANLLQRRQPTLFEPVKDAAMTIRRDDVSDGLRVEEMLAEPAISATAKPSIEIPSARLSRPPEDAPERQRPPSPEKLTPNTIDVRVTAARAQPGPVDAEPTVLVDQQDHSTIREESVPVHVTEPVPSDHAKTATHEHSVMTLIDSKLEAEVVFQNRAREHQPKKKNLLEQAPETSPRSFANKAAAERSNVQIETRVRNDGNGLIKPQAQRRAPTQETQRATRTRLRSEQHQQADQAIPTINVTIGRVEVRATAPSRRVEPARPAGPKLSLEDYLRGRSKGN